MPGKKLDNILTNIKGHLEHFPENPPNEANFENYYLMYNAGNRFYSDLKKFSDNGAAFNKTNMDFLQKEYLDAYYATLHYFNRSGSAERKAAAKQLVDTLMSIQPVMLSLKKASELSDNFTEQYTKNGLKKTIRQISDTLSADIQKIKPADVYALSVKDASIGSMPLFIWLAQMQYCAQITGRADNVPDLYKNKFNDIRAFLKNLPIDKQVGFALNLEKYRISLTNLIVEKKSKNANLAISSTPEFLQLKALELLALPENSFAAGVVRRFRSNNRREDEIIVENILAEKEPTKATKQAANEALNKANYAPTHDFDRSLFSYYELLLQNSNKRGGHYKSVVRLVGRLLQASRDTGNERDLFYYNALLQETIEAISIYQHGHRGNLKGKPKERYDLMTSIQDGLLEVQKSVSKSLEQMPDIQDEDLVKEGMNEVERADIYNEVVQLQKLGSVRKAGAIPFVAKTSKYEPEISGKKRAFGSVCHHLMNGIRSIFTTPDFLFSWFKNPFRKNAYSKVSARNFNVIPGLSTYETFKKEKPDEQPFNQDIISDNRRVPLIWETKILDDPDQPPVVILKTEQSYVGNTRSAGGPGDVGHAFLTLQYSKKDPISGKMARYQCTFGFHPDPIVRRTNLESGSQTSVMGYQGGLIPGILEDDSNSNYDVSKTFQVNNRQINKILLAAQTYAKDGYNLITRNCTSFTKEMLEHADIDTTGLYQKVDFNMDALSAGGVALGAILASPFYSVAKRGLGKYAHVQDRVHYQTLGQETITQKDLKLLSGKSLNLRLEGYQPSRLGEMIRRQENESLLSYNDKSMGENMGEKLENSRVTFLTAIRGYCSRKTFSEKERTHIGSIIEALDSKLFNENQILESYLIGLDENRKETETLEQYRNRLIHDATYANKIISQTKTSLEEIWRDTFHGDIEVMISFQELTATYERLSTRIGKVYNAINDKVIEASKSNNEIKTLDAGIDQSREASFALREFEYGRIEKKVYNTLYKTNCRKVAASALLGESTEKTIKMYIDRDEFSRRKNTLTKEEKKTLSKCKDYINLLETTERSMPYYTNAGNFTQGDINFLFRKLPTHARGDAFAVNAMQAFAWEHVMAPMKEKMKANITNGFQEIDFVNLETRGKAVTEQVIKNLNSVLPDSLFKDSDELNLILSEMVACTEDKDPFADKDKKEPDKYSGRILEKAYQNVIESLTNSYITPMILQNVTPLVREKNALKKIKSVSDIEELIGMGIIGVFSVGMEIALQNELHPDAPMKNPEFPTKEEEEQCKQLAKRLKPLAKRLISVNSLSKSLPGVMKCFKDQESEEYRKWVNHGTFFEVQRIKDGITKLGNERLTAARQLMSKSRLGLQNLPEREQNNIAALTSKVMLPSILCNASFSDQRKIFDKIAKDNDNYEKLSDRLANSKSFQGLLRQTFGENCAPNLKAKEDFEALKNNVTPAMVKNIFKEMDLSLNKERAVAQFAQAGQVL